MSFILLMLWSGLWFAAAVFLVFLLIAAVRKKELSIATGLLTYPIGIILAVIYFYNQ